MSNLQKIDTEISDFIGFINKGGKIRPFVKDVYLITVDVAGLSYIEYIDDLFPEIKNGSYLELFRQSDNEYDVRAIIVKFQGKKIGYVPRNSNEVLANLMDAGKMLYGVVESSKSEELYENYEFKTIRFKIYLKEEF